MKKWSVMHAPIEIAGQTGLLCGELGRMGWRAVGYHYFRSFHGYRSHLHLTDRYELMELCGAAAARFDLFHFHFSMSMLPGLEDLELIGRTGKPMLMHHWGNDVRTADALRGPHPPGGRFPSEEIVRERLSRIGARIPTAIVQDFEVYPYVRPYYRDVRVLPLAIDLGAFRPRYPDAGEREPLVVHAPTDQAFKGTAVIERVLASLRKRHRFRYRRIERLPRSEALALYREADIVVDQILCGSYGMLAVEAMALGKPVVVRVREELAHTFGESPPPVCGADPDTLHDTLDALLRSGELRRRKGIAGRQYVERRHDSRIVAAELAKLYRGLLA